MLCYLGALDEEPWRLSANIVFINPVTPCLILLRIKKKKKNDEQQYCASSVDF